MISDMGATQRQPLLLLIEPAGQHRFNYTKFEPTTGEAVWRWPSAPASPAPVAAIGHVLDVSV